MDRLGLLSKIKITAEQNLTQLDLSDNHLSFLPPEIAQLTNLTALDISGNQLTSLPTEIFQLTNLTELRLGKNPLTSLPPEITHLTDLTKLDISDIQLTFFPPEVVQLTNLIVLEISGNQLTTLPPEVVQLTNLTNLYMRRNQLAVLPPEFSQLTNLIALDISSNRLSVLPLEIAQLTNLTSIFVYHNKLTDLPPEIAQLTNLTELYLGSNQLTSLPPEITQLTNLTKLEVYVNQLTTLPLEITQLTNLTKLNLFGNRLTVLPPEIAHLTNLTELDISYNRLTVLPPEIAQLTNLTELKITGNQLTILPSEIAQLTNLTKLKITGNRLTVLPPEITQLTNLTVLDISENQLTVLPPEITQLTNLTELDISENQLTVLPPEITQLTNLTELDISKNQLTVLPPEITQLTNLTKLAISENQLTVLPPEITQLTNLTELDISGFQQTTLPHEIAKLTNLTKLDISDNQLTVLPIEIVQLTNLSKLDISGNQLGALPPEIAQLTNLTFLNISGNQLSALPPEIAQLAHLQLELDNNPLSAFPPEIVEQGKFAILTYLRELLQGYQPKWVSKLVLVGEGGVGKTSLLRALRGESFTDSLTTRGIEICNLKLPHSAQKNVSLSLNAWDFGGQEIYHATHQFFLTNRSLFLLVWNARHGYEQGKLYYWLDAIQARAPDSPILVVAAWIDERDADLPAADLQRKYPQIVGFYHISNKNGLGISDLQKAIAHVATTHLPLMGEKWPKTWLAAAADIRSRDEKYITPDELWAIMSAHGVSTAGSRVLARWLHELGDILFFRDKSELNDLVILKPQWVTQYIGKVLESDDVIGRSGIFTDDHMQTLWGDLEPSMRQHFLRLMENFDLSYRTLEDQEVSLIVERLPLDPPNYQSLWNKNVAEGSQHEISMKFKLNTMLPGIPTWFIARSHRFTTHTHWRLGAVFSYDLEQKHLALIQAFPHDRYVQLTVRGPSPHNFFALLKDGLEVTLARYPGLNIERTVPCPGHDDQPCGYEFNYENLQKAIDRENPIEYLQCQTAFENVSVSQLLFGLHWRTQDNVLAEIEELSTKFDQMERNSATRHDELVTLLQREFTKSFRREQARIESYCPNVFVLRPYISKTWKKILLGEKLELQLYCQAPGCWHPTQEGGHYVFDNPPKWLRAAGSYIRDMVILLKLVTPLIGPWIGVSAVDYAKSIANDIKFMEGLVKIIPEIVETSEIKIPDHIEVEPVPTQDAYEYTEGAGLRAVRQLLEKLDEHQVWGGLMRVLTPEAHYLWLCEYHAQEYRR
ncbi:MAG: leucine-rich repeat domain-containing protein [Chloroflexota bacterium]